MTKIRSVKALNCSRRLRRSHNGGSSPFAGGIFPAVALVRMVCSTALFALGMVATSDSAEQVVQATGEDKKEIHGVDSDSARREEVAEAVRQARLKAQAAGEVESQVDIYRSAISAILPRCQFNPIVHERLQAALDRSDAKNETAGDASGEAGVRWQKQAAQLKAALSEAEAWLGFEPWMQAPLAEGYPQPTPAGEIRVKRYPSYRLARTDIDSGDNGAFWKLFMHIKKNDIAMTAPVEMTYSDQLTESPADEKGQMAFLYQRQDLGKLGADGDVMVMQAEPKTTLSMGMRGRRTRESVSDAERHLRKWLAQQSKYQAVGPLRVLGYNDPFTPDAKQYHEVELVLRETPLDKATDEE